MLAPAQITPDEESLLKFWHRHGISSLMRDRAHAVWLNHQGKTALEIASILYRRPVTVRHWLITWQKKRLAGLFTAYESNTNAAKLSREQKQQIKQVLSQPPSIYGIPKEFWQVKDLKRYIRAEFGVVYESDRSYHFLLQLSRFSWKLPDRFDVKRDDNLVAARVRAIREEIKPFLNSSEWVVLASDETRLTWETQSRRAWLRTNQKTVIRVNRSRDYQSFLGSLNLKTGQCHLHVLSWQNQAEVIKALVKLKHRYPRRRICLIWDNAKWHKGKLLRRELSRNRSLDAFHLVSFPPYAPDANPVEHVWKHAKDRIAHQPTASFKHKPNHFKLAVMHRKFNYQI